MKNIRIANLINDKNNAAANQFVVTTDNGLYFQSYKSVIALYKDNKVYLSPDWKFSKTTMKHLYIFLRDFTNYDVNSNKDVERYMKNGTFVAVKELNY